MKKIDFQHDCRKSGNQWRIKSVTSIDEYLAVLNLRYKVYLDQQYTTPEEIKERRSYFELIDYLKQIKHDPYNGQYDVEVYDRFDEYVENDFDATNIHTGLIVALEETNKGTLNVDGKIYKLAGAVRVVRDDKYLANDALGLPVEETIDISRLQKPYYKKGRRFCEASRLVKAENTHKSMTSGLLRAITNLTLYGDIYAPDTLITAPLTLERYYSKVGCRRFIPEPFVCCSNVAYRSMML